MTSFAGKQIFYFIFFITIELLPFSSLASGLYGERLCQDPQYTCLTVQPGQYWDSLWPDLREKDIVKRLNRMNIHLNPGMKIAAPQDLLNTTIMSLSPFPLHEANITQKTLIFDPNLVAWGAYDDDGTLVKWGPAAGGRDWCPDIKRACRTVVGTFHIYSKEGFNCKSSKYPVDKGGAPMPYCMFFNGGYGFHGSYEVPGQNASHGCVRLFVEDAKWLNEEFVSKPGVVSGKTFTKVIIRPYGSKALVVTTVASYQPKPISQPQIQIEPPTELPPIPVIESNPTPQGFHIDDW